MRTIFSKIPLKVRATLLVLLFFIGVGGIGYGVNSALNGVNQREQVQQERCEAGNQLRVGLQEEKQEELAEVESHGIHYYGEFLGGTEAQLRQLRQESIAKIKERIHRYAPEECAVVVK